MCVYIRSIKFCLFIPLFGVRAASGEKRPGSKIKLDTHALISYNVLDH